METPRKFWKRMVYILLICLVIFTFTLYASLDKKGNQNDDEYQFDFMDPSQSQNSQEKIVFQGERIVHLDLKGAPPKISYYKNLFPLLSKLGATGLLIEYEDMFPYKGDLLKHVPATNAYSLNDINIINNLAEVNNLTVIPLVQSFGHLEFLLKLKEFSFLREIPKYPEVICPTHNMTLVILYDMIQQVLRAHPKSTMIHIGADEVYYIGKCGRCKQVLLEEQMSTSQLFISHIKRIANRIKMNFPHVRILMWDDEFRNILLDDLNRSAIGLYIEPVVWKYTENVLGDLGYNLFSTYTKIFQKIWFASAFKGATGSNQYLTSISYHIGNHQSWMNIYRDFKSKTKVQGIFITGWQRYNHFAILCELLPVAIPSLACCLETLMSYDPEEEFSGFSSNTQSQLNCRSYHALTYYNSALPECKYPGGHVLDVIMEFHQLKRNYESFLERSPVQGWMTSYNKKYNFTSPELMAKILNDLMIILSELDGIKLRLMNSMLEVYDNYTAVEWQETHFQPLYQDIRSKVVNFNNLLSISEWPRRPLV